MRGMNLATANNKQQGKPPRRIFREADGACTFGWGDDGAVDVDIEDYH